MRVWRRGQDCRFSSSDRDCLAACVFVCCSVVRWKCLPQASVTAEGHLLGREYSVFIVAVWLIVPPPVFMGVARGHTRGLVARAAMLLLLATATAWNVHPVGARRTTTRMQVTAPRMQAEDPEKLREQLLAKLAKIENALRRHGVASTDSTVPLPPPPPRNGLLSSTSRTR